ncbi:hypothetical protein D3C84_450190 [compost metagenome]
MPLIGVAHRQPVFGEGPELLDQPVVMLLGPLAGEEGLGFGAVVSKLGAVAPLGIQGVRQGHFLRVAAVPAIFGQANFQDGGFTGERGKRRTNFIVRGHDLSPMQVGVQSLKLPAR